MTWSAFLLVASKFTSADMLGEDPRYENQDAALQARRDMYGFKTRERRHRRLLALERPVLRNGQQASVSPRFDLTPIRVPPCLEHRPFKRKRSITSMSLEISCVRPCTLWLLDWRGNLPPTQHLQPGHACSHMQAAFRQSQWVSNDSQNKIC